MTLPLLSGVPGIRWPAVPDVANAPLLALLAQFEHTQWWSAERLRDRQFEQLQQLLQHALRTSEGWRRRLERAGLGNAEKLTPAAFAELPILSRRELQSDFDALLSRAPPADHGRIGEGRTSGSTGMPIRVLSSQLQGLIWSAFTLREALWHERNFASKLVSLRVETPEAAHRDWGPPYRGLLATGPAATNDISRDIGELHDWLIAQSPGYLLSHPTVVRDLVRVSAERGTRPQSLRQVVTYGEALPDDLRECVHSDWHAGLADMYSTSECGYVALQCPVSQHHHVQSENVLVEVLHENGRPCAPGETGQVVVTVLHAFAQPLIRYAIGDYAEVGAACACGRGLPVLTRILGRSRNMIRLPDGRRIWPMLNMFEWHTRFGVRQGRVIQTALDALRVEVVPDPRRALDADGLAALLCERVAHPMHVAVVTVERIDRAAAGGKYEDLVSLLP